MEITSGWPDLSWIVSCIFCVWIVYSIIIMVLIFSHILIASIFYFLNNQKICTLVLDHLDTCYKVVAPRETWPPWIKE